MYQEEVLTCQNKVGFVESLSLPLAAHHDDSDVEDSDKENTSSKINKKTSFDDVAAIVHKPLKSSKKMNKVLSKAIKSTEYSAKDLLIPSQSYIHVSENAIEGVSQRKNKFRVDVAGGFKKLRTQQEEYDHKLQKKEKYNKGMLQGEF